MFDRKRSVRNSCLILGGGTLFALEVTADGNLKEISTSQWSDGLFDVAWSECDANIVATASGDGTLQLWNLSNPQVSCRRHLRVREYSNLFRTPLL
jgi:WD40 repeat protein